MNDATKLVLIEKITVEKELCEITTCQFNAPSHLTKDGTPLYVTADITLRVVLTAKQASILQQEFRR